jgi:hypothetical protein
LQRAHLTLKGETTPRLWFEHIADNRTITPQWLIDCFNQHVKGNRLTTALTLKKAQEAIKNKITIQMPAELDIKRSSQGESKTIASFIPSTALLPYLNPKETVSFCLASKTLAEQAGIIQAPR